MRLNNKFEKIKKSTALILSFALLCPPSGYTARPEAMARSEARIDLINDILKTSARSETRSTPEELRAQLKIIAARMVPSDKGILAADESVGSAKNRLDMVGLENNKENRQAMRRLMLTVPGQEQAISAVILDQDTFDNVDHQGRSLVQRLLVRGILPGIKTDKGLIDDPNSPGEKLPNFIGLAQLSQMLDTFKPQGAVFTKWRITQTIDTNKHLPTDTNIRQNAEVLAKTAKITQAAGLVPIVEPEVLLDGTHDIATSYKATTRTLQLLFEELVKEGVWLDGVILKTSMVLSGDKAAVRADAETVGYQTLKGLLKTVPAEIPAIVFLSGGQKDDEVVQNLDAVSRASQIRFKEARDEAAKELKAEGNKKAAKNLRKLKNIPWQISYSFGRGLQRPGLIAWQGKEENFDKAQQALHNVTLATQAARLGQLNTRSEARQLQEAIDEINTWQAENQAITHERHPENPFRTHFLLAVKEIYEKHRLYELSPEERLKYVDAAFDAENFPKVHATLHSILARIDFNHNLSVAAMNPAQYYALGQILSDIEDSHTFYENRLIRAALNRVFDFWDREKRILELSHLVNEMDIELEQPGHGNLPLIAAMQDLHGGSQRAASLVGYVLGLDANIYEKLASYEGAELVERLKLSLFRKGIRIEDAPVRFIGLSDKYDRGDDPVGVFEIVKWLKDNGKAKPFLGNHDLWRMIAVLGIQHYFAAQGLDFKSKAVQGDHIAHWAREAFVHTGWGDIELDQINQRRFNQALSTINEILESHSLEVLEPINLAAFREIYEKELKEKKKHNAVVRNSLQAKDGKYSDKDYLELPNIFEQTLGALRRLKETYNTRIRDINREKGLDIPAIEFAEVNLENYWQDPEIIDRALWELKNSRLFHIDILGSLHQHNIIPFDEANGGYDVEYLGVKGLPALELMEEDLISFGEKRKTLAANSQAFREMVWQRIGDALTLTSSWYSDLNPVAKVPAVQKFITSGGLPALGRGILGENTRLYSEREANFLVFWGHNEIKKFNDPKVNVPYFYPFPDQGTALVNIDYEMSRGYSDQGAVVTLLKRDTSGKMTGFRRWGYRPQSSVIEDLTFEGTEALNEKQRSFLEMLADGEKFLRWYRVRALNQIKSDAQRLETEAREKGRQEKQAYFSSIITDTDRQLLETDGRRESLIRPRAEARENQLRVKSAELRVGQTPWEEDADPAVVVARAKASKNFEEFLEQDPLLKLILGHIPKSRQKRNRIRNVVEKLFKAAQSGNFPTGDDLEKLLEPLDPLQDQNWYARTGTLLILKAKIYLMMGNREKAQAVLSQSKEYTHGEDLAVKAQTVPQSYVTIFEDMYLTRMLEGDLLLLQGTPPQTTKEVAELWMPLGIPLLVYKEPTNSIPKNELHGVRTTDTAHLFNHEDYQKFYQYFMRRFEALPVPAANSRAEARDSLASSVERIADRGQKSPSDNLYAKRYPLSANLSRSEARMLEAQLQELQKELSTFADPTADEKVLDSASSRISEIIQALSHQNTSAVIDWKNNVGEAALKFTERPLFHEKFAVKQEAGAIVILTKHTVRGYSDEQKEIKAANAEEVVAKFSEFKFLGVESVSVVEGNPQKIRVSVNLGNENVGIKTFTFQFQWNDTRTLNALLTIVQALNFIQLYYIETRPAARAEARASSVLEKREELPVDFPAVPDSQNKDSVILPVKNDTVVAHTKTVSGMTAGTRQTFGKNQRIGLGEIMLGFFNNFLLYLGGKFQKYSLGEAGEFVRDHARLDLRLTSLDETRPERRELSRVARKPGDEASTSSSSSSRVERSSTIARVVPLPFTRRTMPLSANGSLATPRGPNSTTFSSDKPFSSGDISFPPDDSKYTTASKSPRAAFSTSQDSPATRAEARAVDRRWINEKLHTEPQHLIDLVRTLLDILEENKFSIEISRVAVSPRYTNVAIDTSLGNGQAIEWSIEKTIEPDWSFFNSYHLAARMKFPDDSFPLLDKISMGSINWPADGKRMQEYILQAVQEAKKEFAKPGRMEWFSKDKPIVIDTTDGRFTIELAGPVEPGQQPIPVRIHEPGRSEARMLVLSRQRNESIMIGDNITITIVDIRGDKVRLGITAPSEIPVHRQEVYEAIQRENQREAGKERRAAELEKKKKTHKPEEGPAGPGPAERSEVRLAPIAGMDLSGLRSPRVSEDVKRSVLAGFTSSLTEPWIMDDKFVEMGALVLVEALDQSPVNAVVTTNPKVLADVAAFNRQFPQIKILTAGTVPEARSKLRKAILELGGVTPQALQFRGMVAETAPYEVQAEFIKELGRQVTILTQQRLNQMAERMGVADAVALLASTYRRAAEAA